MTFLLTEKDHLAVRRKMQAFKSEWTLSRANASTAEPRILKSKGPVILLLMSRI